MRLLIATLARGAIGGVESYLRGIAPRLAGRNGFELALLCEHRYEKTSSSPDPYATCTAEWCVEDTDPAAALAAARDWRPDLVWVHGLESGELEAGLIDMAPAMLFAHNYDGTCATGAKFRLWPHPQACGRRMGGACVAINFTHNCGRLRPSGFARQWERQRQRAAQLGRYRRVLVASRHMEAEFRRQGVAADRLVRMAYPRLGPMPRPPVPRPGPPDHVVMLSRLTRAKGGRELLYACDAAQRTLGRRLRVTIAGDGPERERLRSLAAELKLDVHFPGWLDAAQSQALLMRADLMAVPSLWPEPFGMVGIEAAAFGVPAVGFAVGGIVDWLRPGINGEIAAGDPPSVARLAAAIVRALREPAHWERLRQGAFAGVGEYDLETYLDRLEPVLQVAVRA